MGNEICGIYKITNTITNESYIGKSTNIEKRFQTHKQDLENGTHHNKGLQEDYNLAKSLNPNFEIFIYNIIKEIGDEKDLNKEEMFWINEYNAFERGYNRTLGGVHDETKGHVDYGGGRLFSDDKRVQLIEDKVLSSNTYFEDSSFDMENKESDEEEKEELDKVDTYAEFTETFNKLNKDQKENKEVDEEEINSADELFDKSFGIIVSCRDENNPHDGLTFDERLEKKIQDEQDPQIKAILKNRKTQKTQTYTQTSNDDYPYWCCAVFIVLLIFLWVMNFFK